MKDENNIYENKLKDETNKKSRINASSSNFYQTLTLLGIGLILVGVYTAAIVLYYPLIGSIPPISLITLLA